MFSETRSCDAVADGGRIAALFARPLDESRFDLDGGDRRRRRIDSRNRHRTTVEREYASLTPECPQAHWFEREIFEQYGLRPVGHPWLKPIRFPHASERFRETIPRTTVPAERPTSSRWTAKKCMKSPWGRSMRASSSRGISAFNATAKRSIIWKFRWDISIAASNGR